MSFKDDPRYRKVGDGEYEDLETGDIILEVSEETGSILKKTFGLQPDEDDTVRLTPEVFQALIVDPLKDLYSDDSDLNDL